MPIGFRKSKRFERVASLELPPSQWERAWTGLRHRDVLARIALAVLAAIVMTVVIRGWEPPFSYRTGYVPQRDIVASNSFTRRDEVATLAAQERERSQTRYVYAQDAEPLVQLRALLRNTLIEVTAAPTADKLDAKLLQQFQIPVAKTGNPESVKTRDEQWQKFRAFFTPQENLDAVEKALAEVFAPFEKTGLLAKLSDKQGPGNQQEIVVYPAGHPESQQIVLVSDVLIGPNMALGEALRKNPTLAPVADPLFAWLLPQLKPTLTVDEQLTKQSMDAAVKRVAEVVEEYSVGQTLAKAGEPLDYPHIDLLRREYAAAMNLRPLSQLLGRGLAVTGLIFVGIVLGGIHMRFRQRGPLVSITRLIVLLLLATATVGVARWSGLANPWRGELAPVLLFGMTMAIVYRQELALLLTGIVSLIVVLAIGHGLQEFVLLLGVSAAAILNLGRIRSRNKLIYVGLFSGAVAVLLNTAMKLTEDQPLDLALLLDSLRYGAWAVAAGFITTGLLPFIENLFGVLTDLSLLDLGDVAHPLLQELVRRAPSTYNHSITVGSIAEAAAESIGARGLLVRVGAYFHDIGKMLKPDYFVENQTADENRHETLAPAMSTLVIIAHIKDGADLARQHRLPQPIIDLIAQHHGTTRVEFFYSRATEQQLTDPNGSEVDESSFRYPGPKPQTKEAAVLMLADAVESASRTLIDPTPARIESLVREIAEHRLHGGQFDESGLTLRELRRIEKSMVMSLISIYHGRIKYPEQRTA